MKNEYIPPNPYPVKPPPNMPAPRKESLQAENARLKAQLDRLTKAGDAIVSFLWMENDDDNCNGAITYIAEKAERDWNAAKEGKQS